MRSGELAPADLSRGGALGRLAAPGRLRGHRSDITDNVIRECALPIGLVDVQVAAIDDDWSGLRVVWRRKTASPDRCGGRTMDPAGFHLTLKACASHSRRRARD